MHYRAFGIGFLLVLIFSGLAIAQTKGFTDRGWKVGVNFATLTDDDINDVETITTWATGGYVRFHFNPYLAVQPELLISVKGAEAKFSDIDGNTGTARYRLTYFEVPLQIRGTIPTEFLRPAVFFGPVFAVKGDDKLERDMDDGEIVESEVQGWSKDTDFGLILGGEVAFGRYSLEARYMLGLTSIAAFDNETGDNADVKNRVFSLMIGFSF